MEKKFTPKPWTQNTTDEFMELSGLAITDMDTGKVWLCAKDCAKDIGMNYNTLRNKLNMSMPNNTMFKYLNQ